MWCSVLFVVCRCILSVVYCRYCVLSSLCVFVVVSLCVV